MLPYKEGGKVLLHKRPEGGQLAAEKKEEIDEETLTAGGPICVLRPETCSMYGTANTMGAFLEATGVAPFGSFHDALL